MKNILRVSDPNVYARFVGARELHPLVSVIHYDEVSPIHTSLNQYGVYGLFIQKNFPRNLTYGMKTRPKVPSSPWSRARSAARKTMVKNSISADGYCCFPRSSSGATTWRQG